MRSSGLLGQHCHCCWLNSYIPPESVLPPDDFIFSQPTRALTLQYQVEHVRVSKVKNWALCQVHLCNCKILISQSRGSKSVYLGMCTWWSAKLAPVLISLSLSVAWLLVPNMLSWVTPDPHNHLGGTLAKRDTSVCSCRCCIHVWLLWVCAPTALIGLLVFILLNIL